MLLEKQATKQMAELKNQSIKSVKARKNLNDIMESWYCKKLLTKKQLEKLTAGELTIQEVKKIMLEKIEKDFTKNLDKQLKQIDQFKKLENRKLPEDINYASIEGLRLEARQKLDAIKPVSIGQASRISGVSPADISVLLIYLEQMRKTRGGKNE